jgi:hypothetical protein
MAKKIEQTEIDEAMNVGLPKQEAKKEAQAERALYAYADFEYRIGADVVQVKAGEKFTPPPTWKRDAAGQELLLTSKEKNAGGNVGIVFSYLGEYINPNEKNIELRERRVHNAILPLEER